MKRTALAFLLIGLMAAPAFAQGRGRGNGNDRKQQGVPPGHLPPADLCRVWYQGVPPGRQPPPTDCYEAERIAARDRNARVVYGNRSYGSQAPVYRDDRYPDARYPDGRYPGDIRPGDDRRYPNTDGRRPNPNPDRRTTGRAVPRGDGRYSTGRYGSEAYRQGYEDGVAKGREDVRDRDRFDPARHGWYKSGDRGYNSRYGSRDEYRAEYRRGFIAGYQATHDDRR